MLQQFQENPTGIKANTKNFKFSAYLKLCTILQLPCISNEEDQFYQIYENIGKLASFNKETLLDISQNLFNWVLELRDLNSSMQESIEASNLEHSLQIKCYLKEKSRLEKTYQVLVEDNKVLESNLKDLEQKNFCNEVEIRNLQRDLLHNENEIENYAQEIVVLKNCLKDKDRKVNELNKKVNVNNALVSINAAKKDEGKANVKIRNTSKTPKGIKPFSFDATNLNSAKDEIIKNLKTQLASKIASSQQLEYQLSEVLRQNKDLTEKVKILSLRSQHCSEEEEFHFETYESLRDELLIIDSAFIQTARPSLHPCPGKEFKDSSIQVDQFPDPKKPRYSCFSFFT